ncbi:hypothetical protein OAO25_01010 [Flavobacteriaceae bacterium]|nr:hypothetical protein [Flavobacteriaceae bacterium]
MILDLNSLSSEQLKLLNKLSIKIRDDYNLLIEEIYSKSNKKIGWVVNSLLSRNPYMSDLFINLLYVLFIKEILEKNKNIDCIILIDDSIYKTLIRYLKESKIDIEVIYNKKTKEGFFRISKFFVKNIYYSFLLFLNKKAQSRKKTILNNEIRLIDIFWDKGMFDNNNYNDKYYGSLLDFFTKKERQSIYHLPHIVEVNKLSFFRTKSKLAGINVIFKHDYLKISDYLFALTMPFRLKFDKKIKFKGINIENLLIRDFANNIFNTSSFYGLLNYRFVMRLKNDFPFNIKLFVNWFENQVIDRGLNKGFSDYFKDMNTKGYQGFVVSLDYNSYLCPTKLEMKLGVLPKKIYTCGKGLKSSLQRFNENLNIKTISALRFEHLWNIESTMMVKGKQENNILVILPFVYYECIKIINKILEIRSDYRLENLTFYLKLHPDLNKKKLLSFIDPLPENIKFEKRNIHESLQNTILIVGNTSSACVEALAFGIPAIILGDRIGLTQNPIPLNIDKLIWRIVFGSEELLDAIIYFIFIKKTKQFKLIELSDQVKLNYFEPINRNAIRAFLDFDL